MTVSRGHYELTRRAEADLDEILSYTADAFGPGQAVLYSKHIIAACEEVACNPYGIGSRRRDDIRNGVAVYPVRLATGRTKGAAHVLLYVASDASGLVTVLRILHERMDPTKVLS